MLNPQIWCLNCFLRYIKNTIQKDTGEPFPYPYHLLFRVVVEVALTYKWSALVPAAEQIAQWSDKISQPPGSRPWDSIAPTRFDPLLRIKSEIAFFALHPLSGWNCYRPNTLVWFHCRPSSPFIGRRNHRICPKSCPRSLKAPSPYTMTSTVFPVFSFNMACILYQRLTIPGKKFYRCLCGFVRSQQTIGFVVPAAVYRGRISSRLWPFLHLSF